MSVWSAFEATSTAAGLADVHMHPTYAIKFITFAESQFIRSVRLQWRNSPSGHVTISSLSDGSAGPGSDANDLLVRLGPQDLRKLGTLNLNYCSAMRQVALTVYAC